MATAGKGVIRSTGLAGIHDSDGKGAVFFDDSGDAVCNNCCDICPTDGSTCSRCSTSGTPSQFTVTVNSSPTLCSGCVDEDDCGSGSDSWDAIYAWNGGNPLTGDIVLAQSGNPCVFIKQFLWSFDYKYYFCDQNNPFVNCNNQIDGDCFDGTRTLTTYSKIVQVELEFLSLTEAMLFIYAFDISSTPDHVLFAQKVSITSGVCTDEMTFNTNTALTCGRSAHYEVPSETGLTVCGDGYIAATGGNFTVKCGDNT